MRIAAAILLVVVAVNPAGAASVEELFAEFGLFGTWAPDCGKDASADNPRVRVSASTGQVVEEDELGADYAINRYSFLSAQKLSTDRLAVTAQFQTGGGETERQKLIFRVGKGTRRTIFNQPQGAAVRVRGSTAVTHRTRTPTLRKCE
jgi:hypothetical protein